MKKIGWRRSLTTIVKPLDLAGATLMLSVANVVPAPMREETNGIVQPLECAWTNVETDAKSLVPAPRLELGTP